MSDYNEIKDMATGLYSRRICGDALNAVVASKYYQGDFNFDFINDCDVPMTGSGGDLVQHEAAWGLFFRDFSREWKEYFNSLSQQGAA